MSVYIGKFNFSHYSSNENIFIVLLDGWVERGRVLMFTTFTTNAAGVEKSPFATTQYVLRASDADVREFTLRDLDNKAYYWFDGCRGTDVITLNMHDLERLRVAQNIELTKLINLEWPHTLSHQEMEVLSTGWKGME